MQRIDLRLDVAGAAGAPPGKLELAATAFVPDTPSKDESPVVMFALPGGGYGRGYFDMTFPGHVGFSQAEHHTAKGIVLIALDPLGVGSSSLPDPAAISFESLASTYDRAVTPLIERIRSGALTPQLPAMPRVCAVGIGQSMGGIITILAQGRHSTFDAIAPLGASAIHTQLPQRTEAARLQVLGAHDYQPDAQLSGDEIARSSALIPDFVYPFHWDDVPSDILAADMDGGYPLRKRVPAFGSGTIPTCAVLMMRPAAVAAEAAAVRVPVLVGVGERDVCPEPHREPMAYQSSRDVSVYIVPRMAHMHNFASTRHLLWERLVHWARGCAAATH